MDETLTDQMNQMTITKSPSDQITILGVEISLSGPYNKCNSLGFVLLRSYIKNGNVESLNNDIQFLMKELCKILLFSFKTENIQADKEAYQKSKSITILQLFGCYKNYSSINLRTNGFC